MLTHIPAWNDRELCRAQAAAHWAGEVELAEPGAATFCKGFVRFDAGLQTGRRRTLGPWLALRP